MEKMYAVEYSQKKQWIRVGEVSKMISANIENLKENVASDFLVLGLYSDMKEADRNADFFIKDLELKLKK